RAAGDRPAAGTSRYRAPLIILSSSMPAKRLDPESITHRDLMLATSGSTPFDRAGWIFELKYDGFRILAICQGDLCRLVSRRGNDLSPCFPEIVTSLRAVR